LLIFLHIIYINSELKVRIINVLNISDSIITIENLDNKIKSLQFDPSGNYLVILIKL